MISQQKMDTITEKAKEILWEAIQKSNDKDGYMLYTLEMEMCMRHYRCILEWEHKQILIDEGALK